MLDISETKRKLIISILNSSVEALTINEINGEYTYNVLLLQNIYLLYTFHNFIISIELKLLFFLLILAEYMKQTGEKLAKTKDTAARQLARMANMKKMDNRYSTNSEKCRHVTRNEYNK